MARGAHGRTASHSLFPRRFHSSPRDRFRCIPEHETRLHHSLPRRLTNAARYCRRPETSRCRDWLPCGAAHLDSVIPGGGLSPDHTRWVSGRPKFFLPVVVLSSMFRGKFLFYLKQAFDQGKLNFFGDLKPLADPQAFGHFLRRNREIEWVVYAKPPFGGPAQVLNYLGRYTHRIAI